MAHLIRALRLIAIASPFRAQSAYPVLLANLSHARPCTCAPCPQNVWWILIKGYTIVCGGVRCEIGKTWFDQVVGCTEYRCLLLFWRDELPWKKVSLRCRGCRKLRSSICIGFCREVLIDHFFWGRGNGGWGWEDHCVSPFNSTHDSPAHYPFQGSRSHKHNRASCENEVYWLVLDRYSGVYSGVGML